MAATTKDKRIYVQIQDRRRRRSRSITVYQYTPAQMVALIREVVAFDLPAHELIGVIKGAIQERRRCA